MKRRRGEERRGGLEVVGQAGKQELRRKRADVLSHQEDQIKGGKVSYNRNIIYLTRRMVLYLGNSMSSRKTEVVVR